MSQEQVEQLVLKFFTGTANRSDLEVLETWIQDDANAPLFKKLVAEEFIFNNYVGQTKDLSHLKETLLTDIKQQKSTVQVLYTNRWLKYAAIAVAILGLGFLAKTTVAPEQPRLVNVSPKPQEVILRLHDGSTQSIAPNSFEDVVDNQGNKVVTQEGNRLNYQKAETAQALIYNAIEVPYGSTFGLVLADGTAVTLNAGSAIKYPVSFLKNSPRRVYIKGEAFFDVAHNAEQAFIVDCGGLDVEVYGTSFNVSSYEEDERIDVVLVKGSVGLRPTDDLQKMEEDQTMLRPGFKGTYHKGNTQLNTTAVDVAPYIAWRQGKLIFKEAPFDQILTKLQRHYGVRIINNDAQLNQEKFNLTVETNYDTLEDVLSYFTKVYQMEYQTKNNQIIINKTLGQ